MMDARSVFSLVATLQQVGVRVWFGWLLGG
jgi:hypothetical protein